MKGTKTQKGITLVALIITIIVLLILAVVAIRAVQGDGIIQYATNSADKHQAGMEEENTTLQGYVDYLESKVPGGNAGGSEEAVATGIPIGSTDELKARQVKVGDLVYVANSDGETAIVYGYNADVDEYTGTCALNAPNIATNSIKIESKVQIGENVYTVNSIGDYAFAGMMSRVTNLTSISIPITVTSIGKSAFTNCTNLERVTTLSGVTSIGYNAFSGTLWLTEQRESNDGLLIINEILFDGMTAPGNETGNLTIPNTVKKIATDAFWTTAATSITIPNTITNVESGAIGSMATNLTTINVTWEEGKKPDGWADNWNGSSVTPTYNYNP